MSIELYPSVAKIKRNGVYENLPGFVPETGSVATQQMIATAESSNVAQYAHNKGEYFRLNDTLYQAIVKINVGDSIVVGTNCEVAVIGNDVTHIANSIADYELGIATEQHLKGEYFMVNEVLYVATATIQVGDSISTATNCRLAVVGEELSGLTTGLDAISPALNNIVCLSCESLTYNTITNRIITNDGAVSSASGDRYSVTDYIPVSPKQVLAVEFTSARWWNRNWAFYDKDKNLVTKYPKTASSTTREYFQYLVVPENAKYFVAARDETNDNYPMPNVKVVTEYWRKDNDEPSTVKYVLPDGAITETEVVATLEQGKVIDSMAGVSTIESTDYKLATITVSYGEVYNLYNVSSRYTSKMYAFYDVTNTPVYFVNREDNNSHDFKLIRVPFGAVKLIVAGFETNPSIYKVTQITSSVSNAWGNKKWAAMGDSLTEENGRATKRYMDYIADLTGVNVVNLGKSGTGYKKAYNDNLPFYQRVDTIPLDSDVITIFGSGNDLSQTLGQVTDTTTDTICGCINTTIDAIRTRIVGANIGIITPTPWDDYPTTTVGNAMDLYADAIVEICSRKGVPCLDLYHCSNMLPWEQSFREAYYTRDEGNGVHPDENGQKFFTPHILRFLETLLM